ncbi:hypothetical protein PENTCL1PPCAC_8696, partial [Pristionchus entomophagus]
APMPGNGDLLSFTTKEVWPASVKDRYAYQVDDGTIFYYSSFEGRLYVKHKGSFVFAHLWEGFGIREITALFPHGNCIYFEAKRKIYRAHFIPPDAISLSYVRELLETEMPRRNGLCYRDKFVHRICDDPRKGGILVDVSQQESQKLRLAGLYQGRTLYNQFSYETLFPSARELRGNAIAITCNGTLYFHRDSSPFIYISCGVKLFILDTEIMEFLPYLAFEPEVIIHSIIGVHKGLINVMGKRGGERGMMTAQLPEGYYLTGNNINKDLDLEEVVLKGNDALTTAISDQNAQIRTMQLTIDNMRERNEQMQHLVDGMNSVLAQDKSEQSNINSSQSNISETLTI